jgi:DNA primase
MSIWVNFRELREQLDFREVLVHYGVKINARNHTQHTGKCPLPNHPGVRKAGSFSANLDKGIFRCFGCGAQGNVLEFAALMENLDPKLAGNVRKAALILADRYRIESPPPKRQPQQQKPKVPVSGKPIVNAPLDFTLKNLDPQHPWLREKGLSAETINHFGLGYASRGFLAGRIAIPLKDAQGQLVGYAGMEMDESKVTDEHPRFAFPSGRDHDGKRYEFDKSLFLYNGHALQPPVDDLIIVSWFPSAWWLWCNAFQNAVALMGSTGSPQQASLIVGLTSRSSRIRIFTDGTKIGLHCAQDVLRQVAPYRFCRWVQLEQDQTPSACSKHQLQELLT